MVANRVDPPKSEAERGAKPAGGAESATNGPGGGIKAWLPLIITVVTMPIVAYAVTSFVLVPKLQKGLGITPAATAKSREGGGEKKGGKEGGAAESQGMYTMNKLLANVAGTMGSRYLLCGLTLAGPDADLRTRIEKHEPQLRDMALGILSTKTISDLEKPSIRNLIRSEIMSSFNGVLGPNSVTEIYITEFAIQ